MGFRSLLFPERPGDQSVFQIEDFTDADSRPAVDPPAANIPAVVGIDSDLSFGKAATDFSGFGKLAEEHFIVQMR